MSDDQDYADSLMSLWKSNLESDDHNEERSDELLAEIQRVSPEGHQQILDENDFERILGPNP